MSRQIIAVVLSLAIAVGPLRADFLLARMPNLTLELPPLEGNVEYQNRTYTLSSKKFGTVIFADDDVVEVYDTPTIEARMGKRAVQANKDKSVSELLVVATDYIRYGMPKECYKQLESILNIDENNPDARRVLKTYKQLRKEIPKSDEKEKEFRKLVSLDKLRFEYSEHFLMLTDVSDKKAKDAKVPRAQERLRLLEQVYETFVTYFTLRGAELEIPTERMMTVLFAEESNYKKYAESISPALQNAVGFYDPKSNVSFFFDYASDEFIRKLKKAGEDFEEKGNEAIRAKASPIIRQVYKRNASLFKALSLMWQEEQDITVVSHEATHQVAANTGLFPRHCDIPRWMHEGLATFFEAPKNATWSGIGAVNEERVTYYRALEKQNVKIEIEDLISDRLFHSKRLGNVLHGYAQAWALTHYLMEKRFDDLVRYYRLVATLPPDTFINASTHLLIFNRVFPEADRKDLDGKWRIYMQGLETDYEKAIKNIKPKKGRGG